MLQRGQILVSWQIRDKIQIILLKKEHSVPNGCYACNKLYLHKKQKSLLITNINHNLGDSVVEGTISEPACHLIYENYQNSHLFASLRNTVKVHNMEITFKKGAPTIRLVKHVERGNFSMILYRIAKILLQRGHSTDLVQLTQVLVMSF